MMVLVVVVHVAPVADAVVRRMRRALIAADGR
jgi:chloramphenicol 3-O-phosphotransferase